MATKNKPAADEAAIEQPGEAVVNESLTTVDLVAMRRDAPSHDNGPTTANVHPDEVADWLLHGWELAD